MGTRGPAPPPKSLVVKKGYYQPSRHGDYGYISFIDLSMFKEYCYVYGEMEYLKEHTKGRTYTDDKGTIRLDPLYMELNKLRKDFIRLSQEFGFSPSARTRITLQNKPDENTDIYGDGI
jgi:P27 family predicted phage terminase small subunit